MNAILGAVESRRPKLGRYLPVARHGLLIVALDPVTWTLPGLLWPRRKDHPRWLLLTFAGLNAWSGVQGVARLRRDPELAQRVPWVLWRTLSSIIRYAAYPLFAPRRGYWRGPPDGVAFFMQTYEIPILWGTLAGPAAAVVAGVGGSSTAYALAALANGETLSNHAVRRRIGSFIAATTTFGVLVGLLVDVLANVVNTEEDYQEAQVRVRLAAEGLAAKREGEHESQRALDSVTAAVETLYPPGSAVTRGLKSLMSNYLLPTRDVAPHTLAEVVEEVERRTHVSIYATQQGDAFSLDGECLHILGHVLDTAADNARVHGGAESIQVTDATSRTDSGPWIEVCLLNHGEQVPPMVSLQPQHGLGALRSYLLTAGGNLELRNVAGGVLLRAWWLA